MNATFADADKDLYGRGISLRGELAISGLAITASLLATIFLGWEIAEIAGRAAASGAHGKLIEQAVFASVVGLLVSGNLAYQLTRVGYLLRLRAHVPTTDHELGRVYETRAPRLAILVPSFKEEERVIRQTLWSAALMEYPDKRVVLLIDDPPDPSRPEDSASLKAARALPAEIEGALREPARRISRRAEAFSLRLAASGVDLAEEYRRLAALHHEVADWFELQVRSFPAREHSDRLFVDMVLGRPAEAHRLRAGALDACARSTPPAGSDAELVREYRRLDSLFTAKLSSFERKRFANLSHEPNKAMNLNSFIGLIGGRFKEAERDGRLYLDPAPNESADLQVTWADYLVTLDADSLLSSDYALRLVHIMEQPGNERLAVAQSPYSAVPNAPGLVERIAGATTDMQYIVHQGFTRSNATFWVGANALLRTTALHDIATTRIENGIEVKCFIADRTVIEDTESSVDLMARGWGLFNYPQRLSYSATPADFGSLLVQRRRWANGGLIILPKLLRYLIGKPGFLRRIPEAFLRIHYLTSIAAVNVAVPILLVYPFEENLRSVWLPLSALPYFYLYGRDLVLAGYRWADLPRVYALNLMLIPVNLGGVLKSLQQGVTGARIPFKRTPKVSGVTTAPPVYVVAEIAIVVYCLAAAAVDAMYGRWLHTSFDVVNAGFFVYALVNFVRPAESLGRGLPSFAIPLRMRGSLQVREPFLAEAGLRTGAGERPTGRLREEASERAMMALRATREFRQVVPIGQADVSVRSAPVPRADRRTG